MIGLPHLILHVRKPIFRDVACIWLLGKGALEFHSVAHTPRFHRQQRLRRPDQPATGSTLNKLLTKPPLTHGRMHSSDFIHKSQKITFSANWICRGLPSVVVICEAVALGASENGLKSLGRPTKKMGARKPNLKVGWFRTLKNSARTAPIRPLQGISPSCPSPARSPNRLTLARAKCRARRCQAGQ
jgi:hypothetical protein